MWLELGPGARWPSGPAGRRLLGKLNRVGRRTRRHIIITSGKRSPHAQWVAYQDYLAGGTLAAPCCSRHYLHSWSQCLKQCASRHCVSRAADCEIQYARNGTYYVNIGEVQAARAAMRAVGLCLPVGSGEVWHVEVGDTWRS